MVEHVFLESFKTSIKKFKSNYSIFKKQVGKIIGNPNVGKPMRYSRKGTRELYFGSYRISYIYLELEQKLIFIEVYHKDKQ